MVMSGLMALALGLGVSGTALAYRGDFTRGGPNYTPDFENRITEVMSNVDYEGWKNLMEAKMGVGRVDEVINKDNFAKFAEAWKLAKEGKIREANAIRRELSLRTNDSGRMHQGMGRGPMMGHRRSYN